MYNKSLIIHANARIKDARAVLVDFMKEHESKMDEMDENETDKMLLDLYESKKCFKHVVITLHQENESLS